MGLIILISPGRASLNGSILGNINMAIMISSRKLKVNEIINSIEVMSVMWRIHTI